MSDAPQLLMDSVLITTCVFVLFLTSVAFNFIVNDSRKRPIWNVLMWTSLFAGNGVLLCFYSQEWYARQHCPLKNVSHHSGWGGQVTSLSPDCEGWTGQY